MAMNKFNTYFKKEATLRSLPNLWDIAALVIVFAVIIALVSGGKSMFVDYHLGQNIFISTSPSYLPYYALRTFLRMIIALGCSLLFTFIVGTWAAKSPRAERIIIPLIDILQSIPPLGYLSIIFVSFVVFFKGSLLGPECAAIFTIFTAQVWNMTLSFYQSLRTVPVNLQEAAHIFQLNAWQKFWRLEVPFAMPDLIWNMMMSMSGSWVYLIQSEAIYIAAQQISLPGVGSYIQLATMTKDIHALFYAVITMLLVILMYDQLLFRPLVAWSEKFRSHEEVDVDPAESWLLNLFQRTRFLQTIGAMIQRCNSYFINLSFLSFSTPVQRKSAPSILREQVYNTIWWVLLVSIIGYSLFFLFTFILKHMALPEILHVMYLGFLSLLRIAMVLLISSCIWVPVGVWIGSRPRLTVFIQPIAQFLAAFPINLLFPFAAILILRYHLNFNIWCAPLMILGTQWYILFNVISGASALPKKLCHAVDILHVKGSLKWRKFILPGIFPYFITGLITAAGGAWNITIIAEVINFGDRHFSADGIGAYIANHSALSDGSPSVVLGLAVMIFYVLIINRLVWRPLYKLAQQRFQID
jgi:NitT/TauT family transport system permease protein